MKNNVKLGITVFSLARDFYQKKVSVEDCIRIVHEMGLEGFEIVGSQMIPGYPRPSDEWISWFHETCARYQVKLICYGANYDRGMRSDRDLNADEAFQSTLNDLEVAHKLGAKVMRAQYLLGPDVIARLAPYAEAYDIKVGIEIHSPEYPGSPTMQAYLTKFREVGSKHIGFVPDFGSFADRPNPHFVGAMLGRGAHPEIVEYLTKARYDGLPRPEVEAKVRRMGANEFDLTLLNGFYSFTAFRKPDWDGLREILEWSYHFHGKFYALDEAGNDLCIPLNDLLPIIRDSGFDGYIMSEFEADYRGDLVELLGRHIATERKILNKN